LYFKEFYFRRLRPSETLGLRPDDGRILFFRVDPNKRYFTFGVEPRNAVPWEAVQTDKTV
jgi:hypothetical protein